MSARKVGITRGAPVVQSCSCKRPCECIPTLWHLCACGAWIAPPKPARAAK